MIGKWPLLRFPPACSRQLELVRRRLEHLHLVSSHRSTLFHPAGKSSQFSHFKLNVALRLSSNPVIYLIAKPMVHPAQSYNCLLLHSWIFLYQPPSPLSPPFTLFWVKGPLGPLALPSLQTSNIPHHPCIHTCPPHRMYSQEIKISTYFLSPSVSRLWLLPPTQSWYLAVNPSHWSPHPTSQT